MISNDLIIINIVVFYLIERPYYFQVLIKWLIFRDRSKGRRMMLLVIGDYMGH